MTEGELIVPRFGLAPHNPLIRPPEATRMHAVVAPFGLAREDEGMPSSPPHFAVCSFTRVFDTEPKHELLALPTLVRFLSRFEVKPQVLERMERDVKRVDRSFERVLANQGGAGPAGAKIRDAMRAAERDGGDPRVAAEDARDSLRAEARRAVKRDLRLWAPALYRTGSSRGSENVVHLSCLVLDYDGGEPLEEASARWAPWLHVAHSTWSHTETHPKFRLCLPLAQPVLAQDWERVWEWAAERAGDAIDPSLSSPGATFAVPTVPHEDWPRAHVFQPGPLLDPVAEGLIARPAPPAVPAQVEVLREDTLATGRSKYRSIHVPVALDTPDEDPWDSGDLWDPLSPGSEPPDPPSAALAPVQPQTSRAELSNSGATTVETPEVAELTARVAALEAEVAALREAANPTVSALERLAALHDSGVLNDDEFELAKRAVLLEE